MPVCALLKSLSYNLRRVRAEKGLTQERVAELARLSVRHYQYIEGEQRPGLQVATVERLANALDVEVTELFVRSPNRPRK